MPARLESLALRGAEAVIAALPARRPSAEQLARCRIIGHRGDCNAAGVRENTLPAFDRVHAAGAWGLETDLRWTRDAQPLISHDADAGRVFGDATPIAALTLQQWRARLPAMPSLHTLVERYGKRLHLMIELKSGQWPDAEAQRRALAEALAGLQAGEDYHFIAFDEAAFELVRAWPAQAMAPIARFDVGALSRAALQAGYGGLSGPLPLIGNATLRRHRARGQRVGVGFPRRRKTLLREAARGVDWIFTDHACALQAQLDALRADAGMSVERRR